ncbi:MAG: glycoside hydrolase family 15 [Chloroflexi bacterium]|nr:glycoside hydrolase family 15 [Chloroflexota bacterium]
MTVTDRVALRDLAQRSVEIIRANQGPSGAYLASPSFPVYRYSWLRDGAFIADAMSRSGDIDSAEAFFAWCERVVSARVDRIEDVLRRHAAGEPINRADFLPTRYTLEGKEVGEEWWDFQLDGYGAWLWALDAHAARHGRPVEPYLGGAILSARYAAGLWEIPSYDWWEEYPEHLHTSTVAAVQAGVHAAARWPAVEEPLRERLMASATAMRDRVVADATRAGRFTKWIGSDAVDASLISAATPFGLVEPGDPLMAATVAAIEAQLVHDRGVHRYTTDSYYGGGDWLLLAGFLGWQYARSGRTADGFAELEWIASRATSTGELPEQTPDHLIAPEARDGWLRRWGPVATPLLWSHAMYLTLALELGVEVPGRLR